MTTPKSKPQTLSSPGSGRTGEPMRDVLWASPGWQVIRTAGANAAQWLPCSPAEADFMPQIERPQAISGPGLEQSYGRAEVTSRFASLFWQSCAESAMATETVSGSLLPGSAR